MLLMLLCDQCATSMELNNNNIKQLKPGESLRDKHVTGLELRAFKCRKSFYLYYRTKEGKERRPKLSDYPIIKLADARSIALDIPLKVAHGRDHQKERQTAKNALLLLSYVNFI